LWSQYVYYSVNKIRPFDSLPTQLHLIHIYTNDLSDINIISHYVLRDLPNNLFVRGFDTKIVNKYLIHFMHATCPMHFKLFDWIAIELLGEEEKLQISYLCYIGA